MPFDDSSQNEWDRLVANMLGLGCYDETRLSASRLAETFRAGRAVRDLNTETREIIRFGALLPSRDPMWFEIAQLYLAKGCRTRWDFHELVEEVMHLKRGANLFLFTRSQALVYAMGVYGFVEMREGNRLLCGDDLLVLAGHLGILERIPEVTLRGLPFEIYGVPERRLLVRKVH